MPEKNKSPLKCSLLEAWIGYIYNDHSCPDGIRALLFLRECLAKGILNDADVWKAAPERIKHNFTLQFGNPKLPSQSRLEYAEAVLANSKRTGDKNLIKAAEDVHKRLKKERDKELKSAVPGTVPRQSNSALGYPRFVSK